MLVEMLLNILMKFPTVAYQRVAYKKIRVLWNSNCSWNTLFATDRTFWPENQVQAIDPNFQFNDPISVKNEHNLQVCAPLWIVMWFTKPKIVSLPTNITKTTVNCWISAAVGRITTLKKICQGFLYIFQINSQLYALIFIVIIIFKKVLLKLIRASQSEVYSVANYVGLKLLTHLRLNLGHL